ncbi:MAG TPA: isocitrate/isopropylmalate family dehydrogenase [Myxococcota bacterium]|nr:isocitrate/isopropylmalate family dehydrogenase [Myxococcota bacterium]
MERLRITELLGDGIGPELRESVHAVAAALPLEVEFLPVDLSLERRRRGSTAAYDEVEASIRETRIALKYPTVTEAESPNALLRQRLKFSVIHRPVLSIRGISSNFKEDVALEIVRVATGGTYDDPGQRIGEDVAVSLRIVERRPCTEAARFAFEYARKNKLTVTSSSKHTIQRATDGFFEAIVRDVARSYPDVRHRVELFDALLAKVILRPHDYQVVLVLNEYGDFLSDMACGLVGSLGTGASGNYAFRPDGSIDVAMFDPAGGTAPDIAGKGIANPTAALLAFVLALDHAGRAVLANALRKAVLDAIADGKSTADVGGKLDTRAFTAVVTDALADALA